jgi:hypothetical protein
VNAFRRLLIALSALAAIGAFASLATAASGVGYDISYPQCNGPFPSNPAFGIVGVNDGRPFTANPCVSAELSWAGTNAGLYANTADPGPALSTRWPNGQTSPRQCNTAANPGSDTPECHYDYGWNAAADSYQDAVNAYTALGWTAVANQWWLDVETANSWTTASSNVQALEGEVDYLTSAGAAGVGFYSTASQWQTITGSTTAFAAHPTWLAGASSLTDAQSRCGGAGFTGGGIALVQFVSGGFDNDVRCTVQTALSFGSGPQALTAGSPSVPIAVQLAQAAPAALTVTVSSSSPAGVFSTSSTGPWSPSISLAVGVGGTATQSVYYEDTKAGNPVLAATAPGYTNATQTETISAAALASIAISPSSLQLKVGSRATLKASGADGYGNPVAVSPAWAVSPALGTFSTASGAQTTFSAKTAGAATITATVGSIAGTAAVSISAKKPH